MHLTFIGIQIVSATMHETLGFWALLEPTSIVETEEVRFSV